MLAHNVNCAFHSKPALQAKASLALLHMVYGFREPHLLLPAVAEFDDTMVQVAYLVKALLTSTARPAAPLLSAECTLLPVPMLRLCPHLLVSFATQAYATSNFPCRFLLLCSLTATYNFCQTAPAAMNELKISKGAGARALARRTKRDDRCSLPVP